MSLFKPQRDKNKPIMYMRISMNFCQWGPAPSVIRKALTTFFFYSLTYSTEAQWLISKRKLYFSKVPEEVKHFPGGGGPTFSRGVVQMLIPYRKLGTHRPCDFLGGGGGGGGGPDQHPLSGSAHGVN